MVCLYLTTEKQWKTISICSAPQNQEKGFIVASMMQCNVKTPKNPEQLDQK